MKKSGNKTEYTLHDTSLHHLTSHMSYSSSPCFVCLTGPWTFVYLVLKQLKFGYLSTILSYWPLDVQHAPHGKELSGDLRIRIVALHKMAKAIRSFGTTWKLSYTTVARVIQRFSKTGFTQNRPRKGQSRSWVLVLCVRCEAGLKKKCMRSQHCF